MSNGEMDMAWMMVQASCVHVHVRINGAGESVSSKIMNVSCLLCQFGGCAIVSLNVSNP